VAVTMECAEPFWNEYSALTRKRNPYFIPLNRPPATSEGGGFREELRLPADKALRFALNHMVAPQLKLSDFFALTKSVGLSDVEIRNDIKGEAIADGTPATNVKSLATAQGISILSINALQKFNHWSADRAREAEALATYCAGSGAKALVLVAANDGTGLSDGERVKNATEALKGLRPILKSAGIIGLVECLGFAVCSLRKKSEAVAAIDAADGRDVFRLTHDTFHHHLAGEANIFPERTGLIHISGVEDPAVSVADMRDSHRVLVGPRDRLNNVAQIEALRAGGYGGPLSFEPFAPIADPAGAVRQSMEFIRAQMTAKAA
jgi:2-keto-myo-inositol isomerase